MLTTLVALKRLPRAIGKAHSMKTTRNMASLLLALGLTALASVHAVGAEKPTMATDIPAEITTPDKVETRLGTLECFDGLPDAGTVQKVYDNLDFGRGVEAFLAGMPAASVYAVTVWFDPQAPAEQEGNWVQTIPGKSWSVILRL